MSWLVITAEQPGAGRGVRGYALAWFLRTYFGRRRVALCSPAQVRQTVPAADTLLVGVPTSLAGEEIQRIVRDSRCRRVAVFDYLDRHSLAWTPEQESVLRQHTDLYLKPWFEPAWNYNLRMGLLPLRLRRLLAWGAAVELAARRFDRSPTPVYDVAFLGRPNRTRFVQDGRIEKYDQRLEWLIDVKRNCPELRFWGGLSTGDDPDNAKQVAIYGDFSDLRFSAGKASFYAFWRALRHSRVALAPGGNVPWTYRHYECLYASGAVVTIDYRQRDMLVPLPVELMVHVPDRGPVLPAIHEALERRQRDPTLRGKVHAHLEQYLRCGGYSRTRPALINRFLAQFN